MKKVQAIDFLDENRKEQKYFMTLLLTLFCLILFQGILYIKSIKKLEVEISQIKVSNSNTRLEEIEVQKSTLLEDTKVIYDLLGFSNVASISIKNNEVTLEGQSENLDILDKLKTMNNVKDVSINSVKKQEDKYLFNVVYHIGG